ncbi:hypothetical protein HanIR_Chr16g0834821 [Helianthus annuus]|nr:hypothetical protein HanIR_Chr16g0834821 [Helianthus annuus]
MGRTKSACINCNGLLVRQVRVGNGLLVCLPRIHPLAKYSGCPGVHPPTPMFRLQVYKF